MEKKNMPILPGQGLGIIKFGMTRDEVRRHLGDPDEVDQYGYEDSDDEEDQTEAWHYDALNASFSFDALDDWRLNTIAVSDPDFMLNEHSLFGLNRNELQETLSGMGLGEVVVEDFFSDDMPADQMLSIDELSLSFWLEEGQLAEIQWGPLVDEDDNVIWPE
jgi:hypothetical protein